MKRRSFIKKSAAATSLLGLQGLNATNNSKPKHKFKMNFAPHLGMFKHHAGENIVEQLKFMADQGFTAFEDNNIKKRSIEIQNTIAKTLVKENMMMGVFVAHKIYWKAPSLSSGDIGKREEFLNDIKTSVEVAKRINAKWMTVVPGYVDLSKSMEFQTQHVIESLKRACDILEPHNLTMVLEPLNFRDHPGQFLSKSPQAYQICKAVDSPSCKILFDIYHQQIQEGNLVPNIDACWNEIAYFQIADNPKRKEPTTGEINYKNIFKHIYNKDYKGILGMEHGNSKNELEGELAVINAYKETSNF